MDEQTPKHRGTVIMSVALHAVVVALCSVGISFSKPPQFVGAPTVIDAVMVDQSVLTKEQNRRDQAVRAEQQRKQREERQARERVEKQRRDKEVAEQREKERVVEQQREQQAERDRVVREAKEAKDKAEAAKREQERVAQAKREQEQRDKEEAARKQKEAALAKQRAQAESELQAQLAAEAEQASAIASGLQDQYIRQIADKIERNWNRPLNAKPGLQCVVNVVQIPGGDVVEARVGSPCNGDDTVKRSIEDAVRRASPLPPPPTQAVFQRNLIVTFRPDI